MAKKVKAVIKLQIEAGKATPAPPVGPAVAPHLSVMEFVKQYNERTAGQCAAGFEQRAAREICGFFRSGHGAFPQPIIVAARLTARRMLMWVPQRHLSPSSALLICASVGFLLSRKNAAAVMIQPLMQ